MRTTSHTQAAAAVAIVAASLAALGAAGCSSPAPASAARTWPAMRLEAPEADAEVSAEAWLRTPFPSDERRHADGTVAYEDLPIGSSIIRRWREEGAKLAGFSVSAPIFFAFDGPLPEGALPETPARSLEEESTLQLVDVGEGAQRGRRYPVRWRFIEEPGDSLYFAKNTLAVAPLEGFVLDEARPHAALVLGPAGRTSPALTRALADAAPEDPRELARWRAYAPLRAHLAERGVDRARVVAATVFTTGAPGAELRALAADARARQARASVDVTWKPASAGAPLVSQKTFTWDAGKDVLYRYVGGEVALANYQRGTVPYETEGGEFLDPAREAPWADRADVTLTVPAAAPPGATCLPVVVYAHGTGGDAMSVVRDGTAPRLAARGFATLGFDQPLHGRRAQGKRFDVDTLTFNVSNPSSFRTTMRQGALDLVQVDAIARALTALPPDLSPLPLCTNAPLHFGHSQGGLSAAMALGAGLEPPRTVLSGTGGALHVTIAERKDPVDFAGLVRVAARIGADEPFDDRHPVMGLLQALGDVSDPAIYARGWSEAGAVLHTAGLLDAATPPRSASALAAASRQAIVGELAWASEPLALTASGAAATGSPRRSFLTFAPGPQNLDASHWVIFERSEAIDASMAFLFDGTVRRNRDATVR
jgi:hypothetical protein